MDRNIKHSEFFDIVDENNKPLGVIKERSLVHKDGDWHASVHIYVVNEKSELLVHLRAPFKDVYPNCWDTRFGGHVLAGQTIEDTAVKELEEELGIKTKTGDLIKGAVGKWDGGTNREFNYIFYYNWREGDRWKFDDGEVIEVKWMSQEEILKSLRANQKKWTTHEDTVLKVFSEWKNLKP